MKESFFNLIIIVEVFVLKCVDSEITKTVQTKSGPIEGVQYEEATTKRQVIEFRRIPYAMPPVGKRRFKPPIPYGKWISKLDATKYGPSCYQDLESSAFFLPNRDVSENCLFLNIFVPGNISESNMYSVMIWFHGGNYKNGQGTSFNGALLTSIGNVIVVTVNYRLGLFGFLCTGDKVAPGNLGIGDQILAIKWVRNNIKEYGGNPNSITLFGHSSGAMSISLLSRNSNGLFKRVILQSGFATSPLSTAIYTVKNTMLLAKQMDCFRNTSVDTINCFHNKTSEQLQEGYRRLANAIQNPFHLPTFGPTRLPSITSNTFSSSNSYKELDLLIGNVANEGTQFLDFVKSFENFQTDEGMQEHICSHTVQMLLLLLLNTSHQLDTTVCSKYIKPGHKYSYLLDLYGDTMFNIHTITALRAHLDGGAPGRTFQYVLNTNTSMVHESRLPGWVQTPIHGDDVLILSSHLHDLSEPLKNLSRTMALYWTNFAKTGNVNGGGVPYWPEYKTTNKSCVILDSDITIKQDLYEDKADFWLKTIPDLLLKKTTASILNSSTTTSSTEKADIKTMKTIVHTATDTTVKRTTTEATTRTTPEASKRATPEATTQKTTEATTRTTPEATTQTSTRTESPGVDNNSDRMSFSVFTTILTFCFVRSFS